MYYQGLAGNVLDVAADIHVIVHADIEEVVGSVSCAGIVLVVVPCKSMTMDHTLATVIVFGECHESIGRCVVVGGCGCI